MILNSYAEIVLYGDHGESEIARTKISLEDVEVCRKFRWHLLRCQSGLYVKTDTAKGRIQIHQLIMDSQGSGMVVDHRSGDGLDNRRENLRICTHQQNVAHRVRLNRNNTSGALGVSWAEEQRKWMSQIMVDGKTINLGLFVSFDDAVGARRSAEQIFLGEFSSINV